MVKKLYSSAITVALLCTSTFSPPSSHYQAGRPSFVCNAIIPQTQSLSEWDDQSAPGQTTNVALSGDFHSNKEDEEFVQLDAQASSFVSSEARA